MISPPLIREILEMAILELSCVYLPVLRVSNAYCAGSGAMFGDTWTMPHA
jgi:hypothetical protein